MGEREELNKEHSQLTVRKQELGTQKAELPPKVGETWVFNTNDLKKHEKIDKEIRDINIRLREIEEILRKLPPFKKQY